MPCQPNQNYFCHGVMTGDKMDYERQMRQIFSQWRQFSDEWMGNYLRFSQSVMDNYLRSTEQSVPMLLSLFPKTWRGSCASSADRGTSACTIPTTVCPPYCVGELSWEACEGERLVGYLTLKNTGEKAVQFTLKAEPFHSACEPTQLVADIEKNHFLLQAGDSERVTVVVKLKDQALETDRLYQANVKVLGRYEHCVKLEFRIKRKKLPCCYLEHGEIPTRIVPHQWYHHFQCEALCFKPVLAEKVAEKVAEKSTEKVLPEKTLTEKALTEKPRAKKDDA